MQRASPSTGTVVAHRVLMLLAGLLALLATGRPALAGAPAVVRAGPSGPVHLIGAVGYQVPLGWTLREAKGIATLVPPPEVKARVCGILVGAPVTASGDLGMLGQKLLAEAWGQAFGPLDPTTVTRYDGVAGTGWSFTDLYGQLRVRGPGLFVHVLMARMNEDTVVPILGVTTEDENCLAGQDHPTWVVLFHGLRIPGFRNDTAVLAEHIAGTWEHVGGRFFQSDTYLRNGEFGEFRSYGSWSVSHHHPNRLVLTTQEFPTNGVFEVHGDQVSKTYRKGVHDGESTATTLVSIVHRTTAQNSSSPEVLLRVVDRLGVDHPAWKTNFIVETFALTN